MLGAWFGVWTVLIFICDAVSNLGDGLLQKVLHLHLAVLHFR